MLFTRKIESVKIFSIFTGFFLKIAFLSYTKVFNQRNQDVLQINLLIICKIEFKTK